tara:strand:+ start:2193 stop:2501 length:309 start_codon:yes stop_codon:yes gene_type:complete
MLTSPQDCTDADFRQRHERAETQADAFERVATDSAVKTFETLRQFYIGQKQAANLAGVYEGIFDDCGWPDFNDQFTSKNARKIIGMYQDAVRWHEAAKQVAA